MESETYTEVTSDAGEMFFVKVLSDAWHFLKLPVR